MLTEAQITLIQTSYRHISFRLIEFGDQFYKHLFRLHPEVESLFKSSIEIQGMKIMQTFGFAVWQLNSPMTLRLVLEPLGRRHKKYGVEKSYFAFVEEAFLASLEDIIGSDFTPELREAWTILYRELAAIATEAYD